MTSSRHPCPDGPTATNIRIGTDIEGEEGEPAGGYIRLILAASRASDNAPAS